MRKQLGDYSTDYEPWFERWECVMWYANPTANLGVRGVVPCFRHKTCGELIKAFDKKPPRICTKCGVDTVFEHKQLGVEQSGPKVRSGVPLNFGRVASAGKE